LFGWGCNIDHDLVRLAQENSTFCHPERSERFAERSAHGVEGPRVPLPL
jgi:hypothetical protein